MNDTKQANSPSGAARQWRKKPVVIEAVKVPMREYADSPMVFDDLPEWLEKAVADGTITATFKSEDYWYFEIKTLEGTMTATPGDWIIRGVKGELYPCRADIFAATYEPAEATAAPCGESASAVALPRQQRMLGIAGGILYIMALYLEMNGCFYSGLLSGVAGVTLMICWIIG
jgi:hypothetical protein